MMSWVSSFSGSVGGFQLVSQISSAIGTELWLATDADEVCVVKRPCPNASPSASSRIRNEGESVEGLTHPSVVRLFSRGEANGMPYLVFE